MWPTLILIMTVDVDLGELLSTLMGHLALINIQEQPKPTNMSPTK